MHWMYHSSVVGSPDLFGLWFPTVFALLPLLVWATVWKGWALWLAARRGELPWFIALLIINTVGILEIFYIFVIAKQKDAKEMGEKGNETTSTDHEEKTTFN